MRAIICPTILAGSTREYIEQVERVAGFAERIHIDLADGRFAPTKTLPIDQIDWPDMLLADLHVMYQEPSRHLKALLGLKRKPNLVIVHAEADGDFLAFANKLHDHDIKVGVALKPETKADVIIPALPLVDYVLVFSGHLGHFGGEANTHLLTKVLHLKHLKPSLEIGWDGGINNKNAAVLVAGGVDVLNVGGFIQHAGDPEAAFHRLVEALHHVPPRRHKV